MRSSRIKSTVIVILALVNVCLLILLVGRKAQERAARSHTIAQLARLYGESGVELPASLVPTEALRLAAVDPERDLSAEAAFAEDLLGPCAREDVGGEVVVKMPKLKMLTK